MITKNKLDEFEVSCILREVQNMFSFADNSLQKEKITALDDSKLEGMK
jgi:hypothetical protein